MAVNGDIVTVEPDAETLRKMRGPMTRQEVLSKLLAKFESNRELLKEKLEHVASLPGAEIRENGVDLFAELSVIWKEGNAIRELAQEFVPTLYPEDKPAAPEARPS